MACVFVCVCGVWCWGGVEIGGEGVLCVGERNLYIVSDFCGFSGH